MKTNTTCACGKPGVHALNLTEWITSGLVDNETVFLCQECEDGLKRRILEKGRHTVRWGLYIPKLNEPMTSKAV